MRRQAAGLMVRRLLTFTAQCGRSLARDAGRGSLRADACAERSGV